jgi:PAS domain S-box-containing protein
VPAFLWSTGLDGEPTHVNQRLLDYSGLRFEDFKHLGWEAFVHPADFPETDKVYYHAIQTGTSYRGVLRLRRADGEFRWHHARCEPLRDRQGRIVHWYGVTVDSDEVKKANNPDPRHICKPISNLNVLPAYTWYATPSGALTFVNKRTGNYLGVPKDHPLRFGIDTGARWDDWVSLLHPDDREEARKYWSNCLRTGEAGSARAMEPYSGGLGRLWILKSSSAPSRPFGKANTSSAKSSKPYQASFGQRDPTANRPMPISAF